MRIFLGRAPHGLLMGVASAALVGVASHAAAQTSAAAPPAAAAAGSQDQVAEVVVTAQKRAQNLQEIPVAVTAISQATVKANRVTNLMDLTGLAPGLIAKANAGGLQSPSYTLRGIFATASAPGQDRETSQYLDGVYIGGIRGAVFDLPDINDLEVLRGPQGTLFGRNATAGAVSINTRDPTGNFHIHQDLTGGNFNQFRSRTSIDFPQWGPFSAYFTYVHDQRDGDIKNLGAGVCFDRTNPFTNLVGKSCSPSTLGGHDNNDVFLAVKFAPFDNFSMVNKFDWSESHYTPEGRVSVAVNPAGGSLGFIETSIIAAQPAGGGPYGPFVPDPSGQRPAAINNAWAQQSFSTALGDNLTMVWRPLPSLTIKNITAYRNALVYGISDIQGVDGLEFSPAGVAIFGLSSSPAAAALAKDYFIPYEGQSYGKYWQISDEVQGVYQSTFLTLTAGAIYFYSSELASGIPGFNPNPAATPITTTLAAATLGNVQSGTAFTTSTAVYTQFEFHPTAQWDIDLGGRITDDKKNGVFTTGGTYSPVTQMITGTAAAPWSFSKTKPTYSIGTNYKITPELMVYVKFSTGFLSGGAVGGLAYAPEEAASWEGGIKSEWFDRRLRMNLALWKATYFDRQEANSGSNLKPASPISVVVVDGGTEKARGAEFELTAVPFEGATLGFNLAYTHTSTINPPAILTGPDPYQGSQQFVGGANGEYRTKPLFNDAYLDFRMDASYQGRTNNSSDLLFYFNNPIFAPYKMNPVTWLVNGRVALRNIKFQNNMNMEVAVWSKNLLDNKNPLYFLPFGTIEEDASFEPARTFGIDLSLDF